jgi:hypothetical protein
MCLKYLGNFIVSLMSGPMHADRTVEHIGHAIDTGDCYDDAFGDQDNQYESEAY